MTQYKKWKCVLFDLGIKEYKGICHHKLTDNEVKVKERNCFNKFQGFKSKEMDLFFIVSCWLLVSSYLRTNKLVIVDKNK